MLQADLVDGAWSLLRNRIAKEVLNTYELIPVPSLSAADHFGLFSVFVKSKSENLGQKLKISLSAGPSYYHVIGHVSQVIQLDKTDLGRLLNSATPHSEDTHQSTWEGDVELNGSSVHLTAEGLNKFLIPLNMDEGDLYLNPEIPDLIGVKSVYIITDIMKASRLTAVVTGDDDSWERISLGSLPIGFRYSKFRLTSDGLVAEQMKTKPCFNGKWDVVVDRLAPFLNDLAS